jgi:hypothetical protein
LISAQRPHAKIGWRRISRFSPVVGWQKIEPKRTRESAADYVSSVQRTRSNKAIQIPTPRYCHGAIVTLFISRSLSITKLTTVAVALLKAASLPSLRCATVYLNNISSRAQLDEIPFKLDIVEEPYGPGRWQ